MELPDYYHPIVSPKTSFLKDFAIANAFGIDAIKDTFNRASEEWKNNILYLTELYYVMAFYCEIFSEKDQAKAELYLSLYRRCYNIVYRENHPFTDEELYWFFKMTD